MVISVGLVGRSEYYLDNLFIASKPEQFPNAAFNASPNITVANSAPLINAVKPKLIGAAYNIIKLN